VDFGYENMAILKVLKFLDCVKNTFLANCCPYDVQPLAKFRKTRGAPLLETLVHRNFKHYKTTVSLFNVVSIKNCLELSFG